MDSQRLTISVVIPAYNAYSTIVRAIESVLRQSRRADEIIVVDDESTDDLQAALMPFGERVQVIRKSNGGAAAARNRGISAAQGDAIAFLDADDEWEPVFLETTLGLIKENDVSAVVTGFMMLPERTSSVSNPVWKACVLSASNKNSKVPLKYLFKYQGKEYKRNCAPPIPGFPSSGLLSITS